MLSQLVALFYTLVVNVVQVDVPHELAQFAPCLCSSILKQLLLVVPNILPVDVPISYVLLDHLLSLFSFWVSTRCPLCFALAALPSIPLN